MDRPHRHSIGTGARLTILVCTFVVLAGGGVGLWIYQRFNAAFVADEMDELHGEAQIVKVALSGQVEEIRDDVSVLSHVPPLMGIIRAKRAGGVDPKDGSTDAVWRDRLATIFAGMLEAKPQYNQVRLIGVDDDGRELVRVDRMGPDSRIRRVNEAELQTKGDRRYFREAIKLSAGDVYLSPIEYNREQGELSEPYMPVLRAAVCVRDEHGQPFGIVIINKDMRPSFQTLHENAVPGRRVYLTNRDGDFLVHPEPDKAFAFEFDNAYRLQDEFPDLAAQDPSGLIEQTRDSDGRSLVIGFESVHFDQRDPDRFLGIQVAAYKDDLAAVTAGLRTQILVVGLLILFAALVCSFLFARSLTTPLARITRCAEAYGRGETPSDLPVNAAGEAGVLARAFRVMAQRVEQRTTKLRESEASMAEAQRLSHFGSWEFILNDLDDLNANPLHWSGECYRIFGYEPGAVTPSREFFYSRVHPDDVRKVEELTAERIGPDTEYSFTHRIVRQDGETRHVHEYGKVVVDEQTGRPVKMIGTTHDITERLRSEELFQLAVDAAPNAMIMVNRRGEITLVNREGLRLFGYEQDELLGQKIEMLIPQRYHGQHPGHREGFFADPRARAMGAGRSLMGLRKDGGEVPVEIGLNPVNTSQGPHVLAAIVDISERLKHEKERVKLALVASQTDNIVVITDPQRRIEWVNESFTRTTGYTFEEAAGRKPGELLQGPDTDPATVQYMRDRLSEEQGFEVEIINYDKHGTPRWMLIHVKPLHNDRGELINYVAIQSDITHRKEAEQQLKSRNEELNAKTQEMEQFTYSVSHDLKSPVVSCIGLLDCLKEDIGDGDVEAVHDSVRRIERNMKRMETCINDLLELSRIGRVRHDPQHLDMSAVLNQLAEDLHERLDEAGASLEIVHPLPSITADPVRITELFDNLINNAIKYGCDEPGGVVTVGSEQTGDELRYFVKDDGPGIAEEYQEKVFGLFQRLDKKVEGSGVGLTIVSRIMEVHGGRVWIDSTPGQGATFWVAFPRHLAESDRRAA